MSETTHGSQDVSTQKRPLLRRLSARAQTLRLEAYLGLGLGHPGLDAFIVGFPKVGNTWFQVMLRKLLVTHGGHDDRLIPEIFTTRDCLPVDTVAVEITHAMPELATESWRDMRIDFRRFRRKKVMLLIREPKDTMVSYYMQNRFRESPPHFEGTIDEMVHDEIFGLDKYLSFYRSWAETGLKVADVLLIRYEQMHAAVDEVLGRTADFLGLEDLADATIQAAVEYGSFENMRKLEDRDALGMYALSRPRSDDTRSRKVRQGKIGGYKEQLSDELADYIDRRVSEELPDFYGYPLQ